MNEASVSAPWMKEMRARLPGAKVIKHRDASMIGLPDCSITWNKRIFWVEFKLWVPPVSWDSNEGAPYLDLAEKSPAQYAQMLEFGRQAHASFYLVWVKKSRFVQYWNPVSGQVVYTSSTKAMAETCAVRMATLEYL